MTEQSDKAEQRPKGVIVAFLTAQFLCMLDVEQPMDVREEALDSLVSFVRAILTKEKPNGNQTN